MKISRKIFRIAVTALTILLLIFAMSGIVGIIAHNVYLETYSKDMNNYTSDKVQDLVSNSTDELSESIIASSLIQVETGLHNLQSAVDVTEQMINTLFEMPIDDGNSSHDGHILLMPNVTAEQVAPELHRFASLDSFLVNRTTEQLKINDIYFLTQTGLFISNMHDTDKLALTSDFRERTWYTDAVGSSGYVISDIYTSLSTGANDTISCTKAVRRDGEVVGVIGADLRVSELKQGVFADIKNALFLSKVDGQVFNISASDELVQYTTDNKDMLLNSVSVTNPKSELIKLNSQSVAVVQIDNAPWNLVLYFDFGHIELSLNEIAQTLEANRLNLSDNMVSFSIISFLITLIIMLLVATLALYFARKSSSKLANPISELTSRISQIGHGNFDQQFNDLKTGDEVEEIAKAIGKMSVSLQKYTTELSENVKKQQQFDSELSIAQTVQQDLLIEVVLPPELENRLSLAAKMVPAKVVGGDFYDYILLSKSKLMVIVADVSGKGIAASLFMAMTIGAIRRFANAQILPGELLTKVNQLLVAKNSAMMFATCFLAVIDLETGQMQYANAGHNPPLLISSVNDGNNTVDDITPGQIQPPLAIRNQLEYKTWDVQLSNQQSLFLYTDGVTESTSSAATDSMGEQFGMQRLQDYFRKLDLSKTTAEVAINGLLCEIQQFASGTVQFDDITMLLFSFLPPPLMTKLTFQVEGGAKKDELTKAITLTRWHLEQLTHSGSLTPAKSLRYQAVTEELLVNIFRHSTASTLEVELAKDYIKLTDNGIAFNPLTQEVPDLSQSVSDRPIGGLGIYLSGQFANNMQYQRVFNRTADGENVVVVSLLG